MQRMNVGLGSLIVALGLVALGGCESGGSSEPETEGDGGTGGETTSGGEQTSGEETLATSGGEEPWEGPVACPAETAAPTVYEHVGSVGDEAWLDGVHLIDGDLRVEGLLEVGPCVTLAMLGGAGITVDNGGALQLGGEEGRPVLVTSAATSPQPGDWRRIAFEAGSVGPENAINHAILEYGGGDDSAMLIVRDSASASLRDSVLRASEGFGLATEGTLDACIDNEIRDNRSPVWTRPGQAGNLGPGVYGPNERDGIVISEGWVRDDQTWIAHDVPYLVSGSVGISVDLGSAELTIAAGSDLRMADDVRIEVGVAGALSVAGTEQEPVRFSSDKSTGSAGDWRGIEFLDGSLGTRNRLEWAEVRHAGNDGHAAVFVEDGASLAMTNCTVEDNEDEGVIVQPGADLEAFADNTLTGNLVGIEIGANAVGMLQAGDYGPNDNDGIVIFGGRVARDATWSELGARYVVIGEVFVGGSQTPAVLTVGPGVELGVLDTRITVDEGGALSLAGTAEAPVLVTSANDPGAPGDWKYIEFDGGSAAASNVFEHARIEFGGGGAFNGQILLNGGTTLTLRDVEFADGAQGCDIDHAFGVGTIDAADSTFIECD